MSTLGDRLWAQFGGDVPSDPQSVARELIQRYGSGRAAARGIGVDEKTIRRWRNGETRQSERVVRLAQEARREYAQRHAAGQLEIKFRYAKRDRNLKFGSGAGGARGLKAGATDRIAEMYVRGDREGMARAFIDGVSDDWYQRIFSESLAAELDGVGAGDGEDSTAPGMFVS